MNSVGHGARAVSRLGRWLGAAACAVLLASCGNEPPQPLRISSSPWPGYEPLYLAEALGYLKPDGVMVFELPSSDITLESFRNHSSDIATLTLDETLKLLESGVKLRVLAVLDVSNGADAVMAKPHVKTLRDLKGKRIAMLNIPLGAYMLSRTLDAAGLQRSDVQVIPSAESSHEKMYRQGKADAFITFEPFKSKLATMGAHVLFDSSRIPNEVIDLMLVHEDVYLERHDEVCAVAQQWYRTLAYMEQNPEEAAGSIAMRLGQTTAEAQAMFGGIKLVGLEESLQLITGENPGIVPVAARLNEVMLREDQMSQEADIRLALDALIGNCVTPGK